MSIYTSTQAYTYGKIDAAAGLPFHKCHPKDAQLIIKPIAMPIKIATDDISIKLLIDAEIEPKSSTKFV